MITLQKAIPSSYTWEDAMRVIIVDPRFKLLPLAVKRDLFTEYAEARVSVEKEEKIAKAAKSKVRTCSLMVGC